MKSLGAQGISVYSSQSWVRPLLVESSLRFKVSVWWRQRSNITFTCNFLIHARNAILRNLLRCLRSLWVYRSLFLTRGCNAVFQEFSISAPRNPQYQSDVFLFGVFWLVKTLRTALSPQAKYVLICYRWRTRKIFVKERFWVLRQFYQ